MSDNSSAKSSGIGFFGILAIVFITLKLIGIITWSWWWVLAPIWGPILLVIAIVIFTIVIAAAIESKKRY